MNNLRTSLIIDLAGNLEQKARRFTGGLERMGHRGKKAMSGLRRSVGAVGHGLDRLGNRYISMLTGMGASYMAAKTVMDSADLDKQLIRISQTATATADDARTLRTELHKMAKDTGQPLNDLLAGFNNLIQAGLDWEKSLAVLQAINPAMAVTGARADVLAGAMTVAAEAFDFDLSRLETSKTLLDQMTVAGRLGNAELEDLSGIFGRIGVNAKDANLGFAETLAFVEQLSLVERQPERLATLADSTLRLFTNQKYMDKAAKVTGVDFYRNGKRRDALAVLQDIAKKFQGLGTQQDKDRALGAAFEGVDLDTMKGLRKLLGGDALFKVRGMSREIKDASGTIARDLPAALSNSVDQVARLKSALGEAADAFSQPINAAIERAVKYLLDKKGVTGKQMLGVGALGFGAGSGFALFRAIKAGKSILSLLGGLGVGKTAAATAARSGAGVLMSGGGTAAGTAGSAGLAMSTAGVLGAGAAGYGAGMLIERGLGWGMGLMSGGKYSGSGAMGAWLYDALHKEKDQKRTKIDVSLKIDSEGRTRVTDMKSSSADTNFDVDTGITMVGAGL